MKKVFTLIIAAALVLSASACNKDGESGITTAPDASNATQVPGPPPEWTSIAPGELLPIGGGFRLFDNASGNFKLKGVRLSAERTGSKEPGGINDWPLDLGKVRTLFELDEWVAYTIDYEYNSAEKAKLGLWLFPHRPLSEYKNFSESQGDVFFCEYELPYETYPLPLDDMFELQTRYYESGEYDLLIALNGEIIGGTLLRFLENGALDGMSDEQIASMMAVG